MKGTALRSRGLWTAALALALVAVPARAEVWQRTPLGGAALGPILHALAGAGSERTVVMNGVVLRCELAASPLPVAALLDRVQALAELEVAGDAEQPGEASDVERAQRAVARSLRRPFRAEGEGWGAVGRLVGGSLEGAASVLPSLAESGVLGPGGDGGFLVLALDGGDHTRVWTARFDEDFAPLELVGSGRGDVPGGDVPGLVRFPGTRRALTLSEWGGGDRPSHAAGYLGPGSVKQHVRHWETALARLGLPTRARRTPDGALLYASGPAREIAIWVTRPASGREAVLDWVQVRTDDPDMLRAEGR